MFHNRFLNNKKIPTTAPLSFNGTRFPDFKQKAGLFNSYFFYYCTLVNTPSKLTVFAYETDIRSDSVDMKGEDIYLFIKNFSPNKTHG